MTFALRADDPDPLVALAERQHGVIGRRQLREFGIAWRRADDEIREQRWQARGNRVIVMHNGELTRVQQWWTGVIHAGPRAVLCGLSAAEAGGLKGWETDVSHVAVGKGVRVPKLDGLKVHESRRLKRSDRHPARALPQTPLPRSLIDGATWCPEPQLGCAVLAAGVQQRLVRVPDLRSELAAAGEVAHAKILRLTLDDIAGGSHSLAEIDFFRLCQRFGLPAPERQVIRRDAQGRRRYLDAYFRLRDGSVLVVEVDGGLHLRIGSWWKRHDPRT
jgi:hypothetical protein